MDTKETTGYSSIGVIEVVFYNHFLAVSNEAAYWQKIENAGGTINKITMSVDNIRRYMFLVPIEKPIEEVMLKIGGADKALKILSTKAIQPKAKRPK
jgi:hypothetical protein